MAIYCMSDMHLHDEPQPRLFTRKKEDVFVRVLEEIDTRNATLVLAGDILDMTGMNPPRFGLSDFFNNIGYDIDEAELQQRGPAELISAVRAVFPNFFAALRPIASKSKLVVIPGNHDCGIANAIEALAAAIGVPVATLRVTDTFRSGDLLVAHGHEFDGYNATTAGCDNRGSIITAAIYRAVMPAAAALIKKRGGDETAVEFLPAVRPERAIVDGLRDRLGGESEADKLLGPFVELLRVNGFFPGVALRELIGGSLNLVRTKDLLSQLGGGEGAENLRKRAAEIVAGKTWPDAKPPKFVVFGHTHVRDFIADCYVNLGTWIDGVPGLEPEDLRPEAIDHVLPVFCLEDDGSGSLRDGQTIFSTGALNMCPVLEKCQFAAGTCVPG